MLSPVLVVCSSLLVGSIPLYEFVHSRVERHLGCFQFGEIMNETAINILYKSFVDIEFYFSRINTYSGISGA